MTKNTENFHNRNSQQILTNYGLFIMLFCIIFEETSVWMNGSVEVLDSWMKNNVATKHFYMNIIP